MKLRDAALLAAVELAACKEKKPEPKQTQPLAPSASARQQVRDLALEPGPAQQVCEEMERKADVPVFLEGLSTTAEAPLNQTSEPVFTYRAKIGRAVAIITQDGYDVVVKCFHKVNLPPDRLDLGPAAHKRVADQLSSPANSKKFERKGPFSELHTLKKTSDAGFINTVDSLRQDPKSGLLHPDSPSNTEVADGIVDKIVNLSYPDKNVFRFSDPNADQQAKQAAQAVFRANLQEALDKIRNGKYYALQKSSKDRSQGVPQGIDL